MPLTGAKPGPDPHASTPTPHASTPTIPSQPNNSASPQRSPNNAVGDPSLNLQTFALRDLERFTREKVFATNASEHVHLFYVGRDDVHEILKYVLSRVNISLYMNMFGYDDPELNEIVMAKAMDPQVTVMITLDKSQAGSKTERSLIAKDQEMNLAAFNTHFVTGQSATHQISHTKGFVADGKVAGEGSTNWSTSGEGIFVVTGQPGGRGFKAQNNTQSIITDTDTIHRFMAELIAEHMAAQHLALGDPQKLSSLKTPVGPQALPQHT